MRCPYCDTETIRVYEDGRTSKSECPECGFWIVAEELRCPVCDEPFVEAEPTTEHDGTLYHTTCLN